MPYLPLDPFGRAAIPDALRERLEQSGEDWLASDADEGTSRRREVSDGPAAPPQRGSIGALWGRPLVAPEDLTQAEVVALLWRAVAGLRFGQVDRYTAVWLADGLEARLTAGGDLERIFRLKPPPGSRRTPHRLFAHAERDRLLIRLAIAVGSDVGALAVLRADRPCPARAAGLLEDLQQFKPLPTSTAAFTRARQKISRAR